MLTILDEIVDMVFRVLHAHSNIFVLGEKKKKIFKAVHKTTTLTAPLF